MKRLSKNCDASSWTSLFVPIAAMRGLLSDTQTQQRKALATMFMYGLKKSFESNDFTEAGANNASMFFKQKFNWLQKEWQQVDMGQYNKYDAFLIMSFDEFDEILKLIKQHSKESYFELMVIIAYKSYYSLLGVKNTMKCCENLILGRMCGFYKLPILGLPQIPKVIKEIVRNRKYIMPKIRNRISEKYPDMVFFGGNKYCKLRGYYVATLESGALYRSIKQLPSQLNSPDITEEQKMYFCTWVKYMCQLETRIAKEYQKEQAFLNEL